MMIYREVELGQMIMNWNWVVVHCDIEAFDQLVMIFLLMDINMIQK